MKANSLLLIPALLLCASSCLKTRTSMKEDTENPDSGYTTKVTDVAAQENQKVAEELRNEINQLKSRIEDLQKKNEAMATDQGKESNAIIRCATSKRRSKNSRHPKPR